MTAEEYHAWLLAKLNHEIKRVEEHLQSKDEGNDKHKEFLNRCHKEMRLVHGFIEVLTPDLAKSKS